MTRKKIISLIILSIAGLLLLVGFGFLAVLNVKGDKPSELIIAHENGSIYFKTTSKSDGYGFTFRFRNEKNITTKVKSDIGLLQYSQDLEDLGITIGNEYFVSVCVNSQLQGGDSEFSNEIKWYAEKYLEKPTLLLDDGKLKWQAVENADYYSIHYNSTNAEITTTQCEYNLELLSGGIYDIFITAHSENEFYNKRTSNMLENVEVVHELLPIEAVYFNKDTKILSVYSYEKLNEIKVLLGYNETAYNINTLVDFACVESGKYYHINCNLSFIYSGQTKIGVIPSSSDKYNKYSGEIFWINC